MQNGWVKLHRKLLNNKLLYKDINCYVLFTRLLLVVDSRSGTYTTGRFMLSELTGQKPATVYKTLKRLEKEKMLSVTSNNKFSTITICNWHDYQSLSNNKVTTKEQPSNTKQEIRSKNIYKREFEKPNTGVYPVNELKEQTDVRGTHSPTKEKLREALIKKDFSKILDKTY